MVIENLPVWAATAMTIVAAEGPGAPPLYGTLVRRGRLALFQRRRMLIYVVPTGECGSRGNAEGKETECRRPRRFCADGPTPGGERHPVEANHSVSCGLLFEFLQPWNARPLQLAFQVRGRGGRLRTRTKKKKGREANGAPAG